MNKWKWGAIIAVVLVAWFAGCRYGVGSVGKTTIVDTTTTKTVSDTIYLPEVTAYYPGDTVYIKRPENGRNQTPDTVFLDPEPTKPDTVYVPADTPDWVVDILNDYDAAREYDTTFVLNGDTLRIYDVVNHNRLMPRRVVLTSYDTTIKKTTTIQPPRKFVGAFTLSGGSMWNGTTSAAVGFQLTDRNNRTYQIEYQRIVGLKPIVMATVSFPIRLFPNNKNK